MFHWYTVWTSIDVDIRIGHIAEANKKENEVKKTRKEQQQNTRKELKTENTRSTGAHKTFSIDFSQLQHHITNGGSFFLLFCLLYSQTVYLIILYLVVLLENIFFPLFLLNEFPVFQRTFRKIAIDTVWYAKANVFFFCARFIPVQNQVIKVINLKRS